MSERHRAAMNHPAEMHEAAPSGGSSPGGDELWDGITLAVLGAAASVYLLGWRRSRRMTHPHRAGASLAFVRPLAYFAGLSVLAYALLSSLDAASDVLFSAHMSQHELLVLFAAPLVVVGRPEIAFLAVLPVGAGRALNSTLRTPWVASCARVAANPWVAATLHAVVVWAWHVPILFEAALRDDGVHAVQHLSFFATATLFWWTLLRGRHGRLGYGMAVLFVFFTGLHKGLLGAAFAFARHTLYPTHAERTTASGGDALRDQELAGLIMWVPAGVVTCALALGLLVAWLGALERRASRRGGALLNRAAR